MPEIVVLSPDKPPEERIALKETAGVLFLEREQLTGGGPDQGQAVLDAPHLNQEFVKQLIINN